MRRQDGKIELGIRDMRASVGDHIAYFWETSDEFEEAVRFLETGILHGDHVVVFGHDDANARVCELLGQRQSCEDLEAEGRLSILGPESSGEMMLSRIGATFQQALDEGAPMIRLLGNIGWGHKTWPDEEEILRFEAKVTEAARAFPCVVICMYDVNTLSGSVVLDGAFGTHPLTIYHNLIRENPVCLHVDEYLERLDRRRSA